MNDQPADPAAVAEQLLVEVDRVAERLRSMSVERLTRPFPHGGTRAAAGLELAQVLADSASVADPDGGAHVRAVPDLGPLVVGDQVAVTGHDLVAVADRADSQALLRCLAALRELRLAL